MAAIVNPLDLDGKHILVTGASSGIGREVAILLSRLGARLIITGRNSERLQSTVALLHGSDHVVAPFDLAHLDDIPKWIKALTKSHGALNGLAHCAGQQISKPIKMVNADFINKLTQVNISAGLLLARGFRQKGCFVPGGAIVFIASASSLVGQATNAVYCATKGGIVMAARALAVELAASDIRVNCISPAMVETEMLDRFKAILTADRFEELKKGHPLGLGRPEDVANAVAYLLAETGRWISGTNLLLDGGALAGG